MKYIAIDAQEFQTGLDYPVLLIPIEEMKEKISDIKQVKSEIIEIEKTLPGSIIHTWIVGGVNEEHSVFNEKSVFSVVDYDEDDIDTHEHVTIKISVEGEELLLSFCVHINNGEIWAEDFKFSEIRKMFNYEYE